MKKYISLIFILFSFHSYCEEVKKLALVIGNSNYSGINFLKNTLNDAKAVSKSLKQIGFEVIEAYDVSLKGFRKSTKELKKRLDENTLMVFYYAGHAAQVKGTNYLQPLGAEIAEESDMPYEALNLNDFLVELQSVKTHANIFMLDSCRNNPFLSRRFRSSGGLNQGLAEMAAPMNTLISYATRAGDVASDGLGNHSPYTEELLKHIKKPNLSITGLFQQVRAGVGSSTEGRQVPTEVSLLLNTVYLNQVEGDDPSSGDVIVVEDPNKVQFSKAWSYLKEKIGKKEFKYNNLKIYQSFSVKPDCNFSFEREYVYSQERSMQSINCSIKANLADVSSFSFGSTRLFYGKYQVVPRIYMSFDTETYNCSLTNIDSEDVFQKEELFYLFSGEAKKVVTNLELLKSSCLKMNGM